MPDGPGLGERARKGLFAFCAACTAWLIVQNMLLIALAWITTWGRP
jgi:hypothetical protein